MQADLFSKAFSQHLPMIAHVPHPLGLRKRLPLGALGEPARFGLSRAQAAQDLLGWICVPWLCHWGDPILSFRNWETGKILNFCFNISTPKMRPPLTQDVCFAAPTPWTFLLTYSCWLESQSAGVYQLSPEIFRLLWHVVTKLGSTGLGADCHFMAVALDAIFRSLVQIFFCCQVSYF